MSGGDIFSRKFYPAEQNILSAPGADVPCKISYCTISDTAMEFTDLITFIMLSTNLASLVKLSMIKLHGVSSLYAF